VGLVAPSHIPLNWLADVDVRLRSSALEGRFNLEFLGQRLKELGLLNFRYFSLATDYISRSDYFVLRHCSNLPQGSSELDSFYCGRRIHGREFDHNDREIFLFTPDRMEFDEKMRGFYAGIGVRDLASALIPIYAGSDLGGKVCLSWSGSERELYQNDIEALKLLGGIVGRVARLADNARLHAAYRRIDSIALDLNSDLPSKLREFVHVVRELIPAHVTSLFEHNWGSDEVQKIEEFSNGRIHVESFPERYERGKFLTGEALENEGCRLVLDLDTARAAKTISVDASSYVRHQASIKRPLSVLYGVLKTDRRRYVLRMFARDEKLSTRFDNADDRLLAKCLARFAGNIDKYWKSRSISFVSRLSQQAISEFRHVDQLLKTINGEYRDVFPGSAVMIVASKTSDTADFISGLPDRQARQAARVRTNELERFVNALEFPISASSTADINKQLGFEVFPRSEECTLILIPVSNSEAHGFIGFVSPRTIEPKRLLNGISPTDRNLLEILGSTISGAILANSSHISTENAKRLIGQIGHEIELPITELSSLAHESLRQFRDLVRAQAPENIELIRRANLLMETQRGSMHQMAEHISVLMDVAISMAQESDRRVTVTYGAFNLEELLQEVADRAKIEIGRYQHQGVRCQFDFKPGVSRLSPFIGDRFLISKIFLNLFRNALKYSVPPGGGKPITVEVEANPQAEFLRILVSNWGSPIERLEFEKIFTAFTRGRSVDPVRGRRGMGLGLYIARRFAIAHKGTVICRSSDATFKDPTRREKEGHRTTFEVKLSTKLRQGPDEVHI
jgi:signal transduction histidine kinase